MTAPPCSQSSYLDSPAAWLGKCDDSEDAMLSPAVKDKPIRPPPGLWLSENASAAPVKKAAAMQLSLADMFAPVAIEPPPGLAIEPPPGLSLPEKGAESDTSIGSLSSAGQQLSENDDSGPSDGEELPGLKLVLALATRNTLKANSPMFTPVLAPGAASLLMPGVAQRTPLRTKLRSKADVYVPGAGPLPFMPMAAVNESWQKWHTQNSMYEYYAEPDGSYDASAEYYEEQDCTSWPAEQEW